MSPISEKDIAEKNPTMLDVDDEPKVLSALRRCLRE